MTAPPVHVRGLSVAYGQARILHGVDLTIDHGEMVAVLGANGSGKSTLVKALVSVAPVTAGTVEIFGVDIERDHRRVPWRRVGYASQRVGATSGTPATAVEVVASGLLDNRRLRMPRGWRQTALAALDQVGLAGRAGEPVHVFSGGQQQRVLIARALVRRPDLLILDEPLAGIDEASRTALATTIEQLRTRDITVIVVLHELGSLAPLIRRTVLLRHGTVVYDGPPPRPGPELDAFDCDHHADDTPMDPRDPELRVEL